MNETEQKKVESVFGAATASANGGTADDKDARIAELERELNNERVEAGRLRKTNDELAALREENAKLKAQNGVDAAIASVPEELRNDIAPEVLRASGAMAAGMSERMTRDLERQNEEIARLREENARRDRNMLTQRINMQFPGFLESVSNGGAKHDAWTKYQRYNSGSIVAALNANDFDAIAYHIEMFCREIGVPVPSGRQDGSAAPDPRSSGGGTNGGQPVSGKTYTQEEFMALYDAVETARDKGDYAEMARLNAEIKKAPAEGRVK